MPGPFTKFFRDRGPHLAAMIAYYALLSFVPLIFLALALLGLARQVDASTYLVKELERAFPGSSVSSIVHAVRTIQKHATALGIIGGVGLLWTSIGLFSVLESAFNIVYGQPNRPFLRGKALALLLMIASLVTLFAGLVVGSIGFDLLKRYASGFVSNGYVAYTVSVIASLAAVFVFVSSVYYLLTNVRLEFREVLPGTVVASLLLELSFQALPVYLRLSKDVVALQAFGGPAILLVWLYVMSNVLVFGAEVNACRHARRASPEETAAGLA
jgi:membrane protein